MAQQVQSSLKRAQMYRLAAVKATSIVQATVSDRLTEQAWRRTLDSAWDAGCRSAWTEGGRSNSDKTLQGFIDHPCTKDAWEGLCERGYVIGIRPLSSKPYGGKRTIEAKAYAQAAADALLDGTVSQGTNESVDKFIKTLEKRFVHWKNANNLIDVVWSMSGAHLLQSPR